MSAQTNLMASLSGFAVIVDGDWSAAPWQALLVGRFDPGFLHNGPLGVWLSDLRRLRTMKPYRALQPARLPAAFVWTFIITQNKLKIDDVLGVWHVAWPVLAFWGGVAAGIFGTQALGGWVVSLVSQLIASCFVVWCGLCAGGWVLVYGVIKATVGISLNEERVSRGLIGHSQDWVGFG